MTVRRRYVMLVECEYESGPVSTRKRLARAIMERLGGEAIRVVDVDHTDLPSQWVMHVMELTPSMVVESVTSVNEEYL